LDSKWQRIGDIVISGAKYWFVILGASAVAAKDMIRVETPAGTTHEMVRVPAGYFVMGSDEGRADERPVHQGYLEEYLIDRFEVNNAQFAAFLNEADGNANAEGHLFLDERDPDVQIRHSNKGYAPVPNTEERPVAEVSWYGARAYCNWAKMRLPTEAMWEKAARGIDGRAYPWGDRIDRKRANYGRDDCCRGDDSDGFFYSAPVGSYPAGISAYGAYDMGGNVWEWVVDWYGEDYYSLSPERDPQGPHRGITRVLRGGSMSSDPYRLRTTDRSGLPPSSTYVIVGFRCAATESVFTAVRSTSWGEVKLIIGAED